MEMESFMDDLLNFSIPEEEEEEESDEGGGDDVRPPRNIIRRKTGLRQTDSFGLFNNEDHGAIEEEDLEWISNKNAFPVIETFVGGVLPPDNFNLPSPTETKRLSPVSVLESISSHSSSNSSGGGSNVTTTTTTTTTTTVMSCSVGFKFNNPVKARSKRRRSERRDFRGLWNGNDNGFKRKLTAVTVMGRKCQHCGAENTPQWRAGPLGPKTLCNACGVRYKSGRLVPEYRPANSPTFSAELHSNSHRKIVEMRKQFQSGDGDGDGDGNGDRNDCG